MIIHVTEASLWPHLIGERQVRYYDLIGDILTLTTPPLPALGTTVTSTLRWRRQHSV